MVARRSRLAHIQTCSTLNECPKICADAAFPPFLDYRLWDDGPPALLHDLPAESQLPLGNQLMSPKTLNVACVGSQIILLAVSFNGLSATLGWSVSIDSPIHIEASHRSTTAWAPPYFFMWSLSELVVLTLVFEQLVRNRTNAVWHRFPSLGGLATSSDTRYSLRLHQFLIALVVLGPLYAGGRFLKKTLEADVYCGSARTIGEWWEHFVRHGNGARCWLDGQATGVEYFPPTEAWGFLAAFIAAAFFWGLAIRRSIERPL